SDIDMMTKEERNALTSTPILRVYKEFNVDQTNLAEVNPEKYAKLQERFKAPELRDDKGMYVNAAIDRMLQRQEWLCPVQFEQMAPGASFSPSKDRIVIPMKSQFNISSTPEEIYKDGMEYYSTFLHEATHSTGTPDRLNRVKGKQFGDKQYGHEEYVAEMTAAVVGNSLGFDKRILDNNTAYIQGWIQNLKENPKIILSILSDVNKASNMLLEKIDEQKIALGETTILNRKGTNLEPVGANFENAAIVKQKNGEFAARASLNGTELEMKPVAREIGIRYFSLPDGKEKERLLTTTLNSSYAADISKMTQHQTRGYKVG
ncbi:MAG: DNA primase, partial [Prevotella sp.]|nr:DNA primase [Prevotella sp.]